MDADSPEVLETLHTLIAPGDQVRLSPYVEAMQFQILFGWAPDPSKRFESAKAILDANRTRVQALAATWSRFDQGGKDFRPELYENDFLDAYLAYYLTVNVGKLQILFLELLRLHLLPPRFHLLDVGVAAGTTAVALIDFLAAWESACQVHDVPFPVESVDLIGVDARRDCLDYSRKVIQALAYVIDNSGVSEQPFTAWADAARWVERNVALNPLEVPEVPTLLVCSNILSEDGMAGDGHTHVAQAIRLLPEQSLVLLLEPGDRSRATALNGWRSRLLNSDPTLHLVGPCGAEHGAPAPAQCGSCWNARRESLHRPLLYQRFCEEAAKIAEGGNLKWQQEYENNLLSWSYVCLARSPTVVQQPTRLSGQTTFMARYIGRYRPKGGKDSIDRLIPEASHGSTTSAMAKPSQVLEYLKLCPASITDKTAARFDQVLLRRVAGFISPALRHGQLVTVERNLDFEDVQKDCSLVVMPASIAPLEPRGTGSGFLPRYATSSRKGIDAIAQRLFGFPAMREFQHQILERVLSGRSIFAIAATGGGKSECYILPAMLLPDLTVVISPLKSLMQDQYDQRLCARYGLGSISTFINSSIPFREREDRIRRMELGYYKLVYLTPEQCAQGRMLDSLRRADERVGLRFLALDEAHCISHWGHDFRPAYLNLLTRLQGQGLDPVRIALTATASPQVRKDICDELSLNPAPIEQGGDLLVYSANRPELNLIVKITDTVAEKIRDIEDRLRHLLRENYGDSTPGAAIVFMPYTGPAETTAIGYDGQVLDFSGRRTVAHFASHLERALGTRVGIYHGKMEDDGDEFSHEEAQPSAQDSTATTPNALGEIRDRNRRDEQERFILGGTDIMVATKGFGMGIDKPNIRLVVHHTTPGNLEAYTQEAGRAGRDGSLADVVLYFTPQGSDDSRGRATADGEVQRFFLDQKYIREADVRGLWDFLSNRTRQPGAFHRPGKVYFTADEVMGYFDALVGEGRYQWPDFSKREKRGRESWEHAAILDRGHLYQEKSNLIERILSVCYRIRPVAGGRQLILLHELAGVGTSLKRGEVLDAHAILASNDRFAQILLEKGLSATEMCDYLNGDKELFPLAARLDFSLQDTASLLQDIKKADGEWQGSSGRRKWKSHLLDFLIIAAPKRGPAKGRDTLQAWRSYAGASSRATKREAEWSARHPRRDRLCEDDDWFYWDELPYARGWEVTLGEMLDEPGSFDAYLEAFLSTHDRRRDEDNRAYQLLLRDYLGVTEEGRRLSQNGGCLRVVMLGYLKTNETVVDGNCGGCSVCRPDERFEPDLQWRKARIVSLSDALSQVLGDFEQRVLESPPVERVERFWEQVAADEQAGRAVIGYLRGWTNRLISETPHHITAYWLRADGMLRGQFPVVEGDLLHDLDRLRELILGEPDLHRLGDMLTQASVHVEAHPARFQLTKGRLMQRLGRAKEELDAWTSLLGQTADGEQALEANRALAALFAPNAAFADATAQRKALMAALDVAPERARDTVEPYLPGWAFHQLLALLNDVQPALMTRLVTDWFALHDRKEPRARLEEVLAALNRDEYSQTGAAVSHTIQPLILALFEKLPKDAEDLDSLLCRMEPYVTCHVPRWLNLAAWRFDHLGKHAIAKDYWESLMACPAGDGMEKRSPALTVEAARNLARLHAADGPYPDAERHRKALLAALREVPARLPEIVEPYASRWSLGELCELLALLEDVEPALMTRLATDWFALHDREEPRARLEEALTLLNRDGYSQTGAAVSRVLQPLLLRLLEKFPKDTDGLDALLCRMEPYVTCHVPRWLNLAAWRFDHLGKHAVAKDYWEGLMACLPGEGIEERSPAMTVDSARSLARLCAGDGPYPDAERHREAILMGLRDAPARAPEIVDRYASRWSLRELCDLLILAPDESHTSILSVWFRTANVEIGSVAAESSRWLEEHAGSREHPRVASRLVCQLFIALSKNLDVLLTHESCVDPATIRALGTRWLDAGCRKLKGGPTVDLDTVVWRLLESAHNNGATVMGRIREHVNGGFAVDLAGVQGFLDRSQSNRLRMAEGSTQPSLEFKILEFPHGRDRPVLLSRLRVAEERFAELKVGQRIEGRVSGVVEYGAFVDLGGFDGLMHKSNMGRRPNRQLQAMPAEGQPITVVVAGIDPERHRVSLRVPLDNEK